MEIGKAFAVAFGLAFLILGGLYLVYRSESVAQKQRENPALPQPKVWLLVHYGVTALFVALLLYTGTLVLMIGVPNYFRRCRVGHLHLRGSAEPGHRSAVAGGLPRSVLGVCAGGCVVCGWSRFAWRTDRRPRRDWVAGLGQSLVVGIDDILEAWT